MRYMCMHSAAERCQVRKFFAESAASAHPVVSGLETSIACSWASRLLLPFSFFCSRGTFPVKNISIVYIANLKNILSSGIFIT